MKNPINILLLFLSFTATAQVNSDSLWAVWNDENQPYEKRFDALNLIDLDKKDQFRFGNNLDTAIYHAKLMTEKAKEENLKEWIIEGLSNQSYYYLFKNDITLARESSLQALAIAEEIDDKLRIGKSSYNLGIGYLKSGDFSNGFPYFQRSEKLFSDLDEKMLHALSLGKMAFLLAQLGDIKTSNEHLGQALKIRKELLLIDKDDAMNQFVIKGMEQTFRMQKAQLSEATDSIGVKKAQEELKSAMDSLKNMAIALNKNNLNNKETDIPTVRNPIPNSTETSNTIKKKSKVKNENKPSSIPKNNESFKPENYISSGIGLSAQATLYLENGDTIKAIPLLEKTRSEGLEKKEISSTAWASLELYKSYKSIGKYKKSLDMLEQSIIMRDSINSIENTRALFQQKANAEYEKKKAIDDAKNEKRIAIETQKRAYQQKLLFASLLGLLFISLLAFYNFRKYKETNRQKAIIEDQKQKVEQSEKYKEQFLANMSHEIRTPMHAISGMVKILQRNDHPVSQDVFLDVMKTSSDNLVVILNDVLDLSKIEAGKLDIESIPIDPSVVVENAMQILKYKAEEKGLSFNSNISDDVPKLIMGDPTRLNQILLNLAGNAIKFTEKGSVLVELDKVDDQLVFSITDTGVGIAKGSLSNIFNAFEQAEGSTNRQYGGTGLGLSISQELTHLQNGKIWVESEEGKGSTFKVKLPFILASSNAVGTGLITEEKVQFMANSLQGIRILLAEDNSFNEMIAIDDLSYYIKDVKIDTVTNGTDAVRKFETNQYDLILMDVQMPKMNGFEASKAIRHLEKSLNTEKQIAIIAMTASLLKSEVDNCYTAGMNNYIPKPYKTEELIGTIFEELQAKV